ncbi:MAG: hypothetical protein HYS13_22655 [Planctomycetia bacterium]|nr:hypothetical protein [Planctomycetia bacterium]
MKTRTIVFLGSVLVVFVAGLWYLLGSVPRWCFPSKIDQAAAFADSFGLADSFLSGVGFALVAIALLLQFKEIHETTAAQAEQAKVQLRQMELSERTAQLQQDMFNEGKRRLAMEAFVKINRDTMRYRHALLALHPTNNRPTHSQIRDEETNRRLKRDYFEAWTELRSNCLSVGLIFGHAGDGLGKAIQDFYAESHSWLGMAQPPAAEECEDLMGRRVHVIEQAMRPLWQLLTSAPTSSSSCGAQSPPTTLS